MTVTTRKRLLLLTISLSYLFVIIAPGIPIMPSDPDIYDIALVMGGYFGLLGAILLWWQYVLGFRGLAAKLVPDVIFLNGLHQRMGKYGFLQILLHPILIIIGYERTLEYWLIPQIETTRDIFVRLGTLGFVILAVVWLSSALLRGRLSFRWWKRLHFVSYFVLPIILLHSFNVGFNIANSELLRGFWLILMLLFAIIVLYRIAFQFGFTRPKYRLEKKTQITPDVFRYDFMPVTTGSILNPNPAQFAYIQTAPLKESHPFTISHFDGITNMVSFTIKKSGKFSSELAELEIGSNLFIDGPYGVFTRQMFEGNLTPVYIAGGIGITPLLANLEGIRQSNTSFLFYGNKTAQDIAYREELDAIETLTVVHALSREESDGCIKGRVDIEMVRGNLPGGLNDYQYFITGPKPMMTSIAEDLLQAGVPTGQIHIEEFSL